MAEVSDLQIAGDLDNAVALGREFLEFQRDAVGMVFTGDDDPNSPRLFVIIGGRPDLPAVQIGRQAFYRLPYIRTGVPASLTQREYLTSLVAVDPTVNLVPPSAYSNPNVNSQTQALLKTIAELRGAMQESQMLGPEAFQTPEAMAALARALISTGQLQLGPEAFQTPAAMAALRAALAGGNMSSSWFGLGGISPGGTTPFNPFGPPTFVDGGGGGILPDAVGGGSILGSLASALPGILTGLAQAGVIRGSVGQFLAPMQQMAAPMQQLVPIAGLPASVAGLLNISPSTVMAGGSLAIDAMQMLSGLFGGSSSGRGPVDAPSLFRMTASGTRLPARQQVRGPDGSLYIIQSLGKATRGSREISAMRRLAKTNGFTVSRAGVGRRRGRRRP